jgi:V-type H+-transporting ATPase subunit E|tara:strand:+ start:850 stop:1512 length:663 start_codon:yes stop_codon:yes gene_type:complete|eukprot:CAMPEP_0119207694 /NCGR_PEP_ID=MMETSP1327-20130426/128_1 /TAXON_ID=38833 /ORGANISM="Micromonas pusilla, Strain RCC2306" /LENGTH=220 /DNA_ID=CAMNT_0007204103 /DNA_START=39 /DNA_END=701 /DNA_ORIENTATION=+
MNEHEVDRQINQMVQFIKQEAEEKASEIRVAAEEEFNIEKLQMVETEKQKIRKEYERKEASVEVRKKIQYSTELNAMRLKVLGAREEAIQGMLAEARATVGQVSGQASYQGLLVSLIGQGLKKLEQTSAVVRCRLVDVEKVRAAIADVSRGQPQVQLKLDEHDYLPAPPTSSGGVHIISMDGKIVCNNSLDDRLKVAFQNNAPEIRNAIFGPNPNVKVKA